MKDIAKTIGWLTMLSVGVVSMCSVALISVLAAVYMVGAFILTIAVMLFDADFTLVNIFLSGFAFLFFFLISRN